MPRNKMKRQSTLVDMTAMTDMVFLLLSFFIMSSHFKPEEPVAIITPSSISSDILPDANVILVRIDKTGRVFLETDGRVKPLDPTGNELSIRIQNSLAAQKGSLRTMRYCIMADRETPFPEVKRVLDTFKEFKIYKFSLVTSLES